MCLYYSLKALKSLCASVFGSLCKRYYMSVRVFEDVSTFLPLCECLYRQVQSFVVVCENICITGTLWEHLDKQLQHMHQFIVVYLFICEVASANICSSKRTVYGFVCRLSLKAF